MLNFYAFLSLKKYHQPKKLEQKIKINYEEFTYTFTVIEHLFQFEISCPNHHLFMEQRRNHVND